MDNSTQDLHLPFMEPGDLNNPTSLNGNEWHEDEAPLEGNGAGTGTDDRIAPESSRGIPNVPDDVRLEDSEAELLKKNGVVAIVRDEAVIVIDRKPPPPVQGAAIGNDTAISAIQLPTSTASPANTADATLDHIHPSEFPVPSFLPRRLPFKKLLPVCTSLVSMAHRYKAKDLEALSETQPLVILLIFLFLPAHALNAFVYFRSSFTKKYRGSGDVLRRAKIAYRNLTPDELKIWQAPCERLQEEKKRVYLGHVYEAGRIKPAVRKALSLVGETLESAQLEGSNMSPEFAHDLKVVYDAAKLKVKTKDKTQETQKKRQLEKGKRPKAPKAKMTAVTGQASTIELAPRGNENGVGTTQQATDNVANTGAKRKRNQNPAPRPRKTAKTEAAPRASMASATSSSSAGPSSSPYAVSGTEAALPSVASYPFSDPNENSSATASAGFSHNTPMNGSAQAHDIYDPSLDIQDNIFDQYIHGGTGTNSFNTPQPFVGTSDGWLNDNTLAYEMFADLRHDQAPLIQGATTPFCNATGMALTPDFSAGFSTAHGCGGLDFPGAFDELDSNIASGSWNQQGLCNPRPQDNSIGGWNPVDPSGLHSTAYNDFFNPSILDDKENYYSYGFN